MPCSRRTLAPLLPLGESVKHGILLQLVALIWIQTRTQSLTDRSVRTLTLLTITWEVGARADLGNSDGPGDSPYYVLMLVPLLLAAFRRSLLENARGGAARQYVPVLRRVHFFQLHPPVEVDEYFEAGTVSLLFC